ncbi:MAG: serine O-acetyltransferase [bacterium]
MFISQLRNDIKAVFDNDPAARGTIEVVLTYPGLHAIWLHRFAHIFYARGMYTFARILSHLNRFFTGIEIHPGATIGSGVFIDHGMGIVIGETAEIGDYCLLYKGVVLGGTSLKKQKRHPTLGKAVVVGSNACILGAIEIGEGSRIGSGSVVIRSVPAGSTVVGVPGKVVKQAREKVDVEGTHFSRRLEHAELPDPLIQLLSDWMRLLEKYEERIQKLESQHNIPSENLAERFKSEAHFLSEEQQPGTEDEPRES